MSEKRKNDHISLAKESQVQRKKYDFLYEPLLSAHPKKEDKLSLKFADFNFDFPLWFSSMTGGAAKAQKINTNLAKVAGKYNLGMGLGSCRVLLNSLERLKDFDVKEFMPESALYTNLGIAQLEQLISYGQLDELTKLQKNLNSDGMIIHINPLQEWAQPEGDRLKNSPLESLEFLLKHSDIPIAVKEVGQGMGPKSILKLTELPLKFIEFAALGGTNFTMLEHARHEHLSSGKTPKNEDLAYIGHTKREMISFVNEIDLTQSKCKEFIISGGINNSVEGYSYQQQLNAKSLIGYGSRLLDFAEDFSKLDEFIHEETENLKMAHNYLERK